MIKSIPLNPLALLKFKITCLVPVYNNQKTVGRVVETLLSIKDIKEVIVINDGSRDLTSKKLQNYLDHHKCNIISTVKNKGKGWAIAMGINEAKGNVILMCDADLALIDISHIVSLIQTFKKNRYQMVVASRGPINSLMSRFFASLSGERIFYKKTLSSKYLQLMKKSGYGVEKIINHAHRSKKVGFIVSQNIGHILKFEKHNFSTCLWEYFKESANVFSMDVRLKFFRAN